MASPPRTQATFIVAGEVCVVAEPATLVTVLGSCVAVCLWSAERRIGGINHYLVPRSQSSESSYLGGDRAIPALIDQMVSQLVSHMMAHPSGPAPLAKGGHLTRTPPSRPPNLRAHPRQLIAKVFGGAHSGQYGWNAGAENILMAWSELRKAGIPIIAADVGGADSRRISFNVATGQVQVQRRAAPAPAAPPAPREEPK